MLFGPLILSCLALAGRNLSGGGGAGDKGKLPRKASPAAGVVRVNKVLSEKFSRRDSDKLIAEGRVMVNGKVAVPGSSVAPSDFVKLDGKRVVFPAALLLSLGAAEVTKARQQARTPSDRRQAAATPVYIVYNKPSGVECTTDQQTPGNVVDAVGHIERIFPVGRLDKDTTGALLLTSDGRLPNACLRAEFGHEKTYEVTTDMPVRPEDCRKLALGVVITTQAQGSRPKTARTLPCQVHLVKGGLGGRLVKVRLKEGRNRQVRKMFRAVGYRVKQLHRPAFMGISVRGLKPGAWRPLDEREMEGIQRALNAAADAEVAVTMEKGHDQPV